MKTVQNPSWLGWTANRPGAAVANEAARAAIESVRREKTGADKPGDVTKASGQSGIRSKETKPGLYELETFNHSYTG